MEKDGKIIGHVMYAHSAIKVDNGRIIPIMTFGPISIAPEYQCQGYGTILLRHSMDKAHELGAGTLAITGNLDFYGKSGFAVASTNGIHYSDEPRNEEVPYFLIKELRPGFLNGITGSYKEPEGYFVNDAEAEAFDAQFPPKEKLKLPGQLF